MAISRKFLGLEQAALAAAADYLLDRFGRAGAADLGEVVVVVPGRRAGRRLLEILVEQTGRKRLIFTPPVIETVGRIPERLYVPQRPFAGELTQRLAWVDALRSVDADVLSAVVPRPPSSDDAQAWVELADLLRRQHAELAADGLNFADVAKRGGSVPGFSEQNRWAALSQVQDKYLRCLDELELWDLQTARLVAIEKHECQTDRPIILVATADMNRSLRLMIDQVAEHTAALVFAPSTWEDRFDSHGCLSPASWAEQYIPIDTRRVHISDDPADQAEAAARCLASYDGAFQVDDVTIGVARDATAAQVQRQLSECGVATRWGPGRPLSQSGPYRLLDGIAALLQYDRFESFAALVRHPDVSSWIEQQGAGGDWLSQLDRYYSDHLQYRLGEEWLGPAYKSDRIKRVEFLIRDLIRPLRGPPRPLTDWIEPLLAVLRSIYGWRTFDRNDSGDQMSWTACEKLRDAVLAFSQVPGSLAGTVSAAEAVRWSLEAVADEIIPPPADAGAVEMLGWLELPLDDAPALIVCDVNEGVMPESVNSDLFLPNSLRSQLGLMDNHRRYARDAYALSVLIETREQLDLIVGRRNADGDPLVPSRLLLAADGDEVARRTLAFFKPLPSGQRPPIAGGLVASLEHPDLPIPRPVELIEPITQIQVTSFRSYLACPYRFYLRHVLRLESLGDDVEELDGAGFGTVLHEVLARFGKCAARDSTDAAEIDEVLQAELTDIQHAWFGKYPRAAFEVQLEQMRLRLSAFAMKQAEWAADGWRIEHTEVPGGEHDDAIFDTDGEPIILRGRVDRLDVNRETGERVILDYKSSDTARLPDRTHRQRGRWIDLQLPLYRHLTRVLRLEGPVRLGYINLPKDIGATEFSFASWSETELEGADEVAREVVRGIRRQVFWPPVFPPPDFSEEFAVVCQDSVFDKHEFEKGVLPLG